MDHPSFQGTVIEADRPLGGHRIVGCGLGVFAASAFVDRELAAPRPGLNARIVAAIAAGEPVLLDRDAIAEGNATHGLDFVNLYGTWRDGVLDARQLADVQALLGIGFAEGLAGYRFNHIVKEAVGEARIALARATGTYRIVATFPECESALAVVTAGSALAAPYSTAASIYRDRPPVLGLSPAEQALLAAALSGKTDAELSAELGLTLEATKKRWRGRRHRPSYPERSRRETPPAADGMNTMKPTTVPGQLTTACRGVPERMAWLERLPGAVQELQDRWSLSLGPVWRGSASCAWVAPAVRADGTRVVLKLGMPHMEGAHEIDGLRFWDGDPMVRLLEADTRLNAMLLERCEPGTPLRALPDTEQDLVLARLLRRLWRRPSTPHPFRPLRLMVTYWVEETRAARARWVDAGLVQAGLRVFEELTAASADDVLLATDLHAGNVLRAHREPWLAIDPKPFVGDRAYDATQHLFNCASRILAHPPDTVRRLADLLEVDHERVRLWTFARSAAEPRAIWSDESHAIARALA